MNHKELCLFFRIPVPLAILHIYSVFEELDESVYDVLSDFLTKHCKKPQSFDVEVVSVIKHLTESGVNFHPEGISRGLAYLSNFAQREILATVGIFNYKQLQAVHVVNPDTLVVTFFSNGEDSLYEQLCHRSRPTRVHAVK